MMMKYLVLIHIWVEKWYQSVKLADGDEEKARDIAMHVAAINPKYISQDENSTS